MADLIPRDMLGLLEDPFVQMRRMMRRAFGDDAWRPSSLWSDESALALDVRRDAATNEIVVDASLPGFKQDEISVSVESGVLVIQAEHREEKEEKETNYYRRERRYGAVSRRIGLPGAVDDAKARASLKDGVLTVRIPATESAKVKQIPIGAG